MLIYCLPTIGDAASFAFSGVDYPSASLTFVYGINSNNVVAGYYFDASGSHGFTLDGSTYSSFDRPGAASGTTAATGINDSGTVVGFYQTAAGANRGFIKSGTTYTALNVSGSTDTWAYGINNVGQVVGYYLDNVNGFAHGFVRTGTTFTTLNVPGTNTTDTYAYGINAAGKVVGSFSDDTGQHGFIYANGVYTTVNHPSAVYGTVLNGINGNNAVVGTYIGQDGVITRGFLLDGTNYTPLDNPSATDGTFPEAINDGGTVAGYFYDATGLGTHGFKAVANATPAQVPLPPAASALLGLLLAGLGLASRARGLPSARSRGLAWFARI
jgi:probable HAF family extracellular repeat protein